LARQPLKAKASDGTIAVATVVGAVLNFMQIDPAKAPVWSAGVNGVVAVPMMIMMVLMAARRDVMGDFVLACVLKAFGWLATAVMALAAIGMRLGTPDGRPSRCPLMRGLVRLKVHSGAKAPPPRVPCNSRALRRAR
jgi:hypothetical protein